MDGFGPLIPVNGQIFREVQTDLPIEMSRHAGSSTYSGLPVQDSVLREYLRVLIKRKWLVFSCFAIIFGVVAVATMRSTRIYDATGSIAINKTDPTMLNIRDNSTVQATITIPAISTPKSEFSRAICWRCR